MDEAGKQLIGEVREPMPVRPGTPARHDSEYQRGGMANPSMAFEPLAREVKAWQIARNRAEVKVNWQFTTADARIKLRKLYPSIEMQ